MNRLPTAWQEPTEWQALETLGDFIRWASSRMQEAGIHFGHGTDNAWDEATFLVLSAVSQPLLSASRDLLPLRVTPQEKQRIVGWVSERIERRLPLPYITGEAWFAGKAYRVSPDVLIPRSPFAELLTERFEPWLPREPERILDMCAGSGCIGIEAAYQFPDALIDLVDISRPALEIAGENITLHGVGHHVRTLFSDGFSALGGRRYDLILANPPYVDAEDLADMPAEFRHEPALALGSGRDGLALARRLLAEASDYLTPDGLLFLEVGNSAGALQDACPETPFTWIELSEGGHGIALLGASELATL